MPNPNNESRAWLYDKLKGKGYNVGKDYNEFDSLMTSNADSRRWVYDTATKDGLNVGKDYDEFESLINPVQSQTEQNAQAGQQTAENQVAEAQEQSTPETAYNPYHVDVQDFKPNVRFGQQQTQPRQDFTPATSASDVYKTDTTNAIAEGSERARSRTSYEMNRDAMLNLPEEEKQKEIEKAAAGKMLDIIEDKQNPVNEEVRKIFPDYHYVTERTERFDTFLADYRAKDYNLGEIDRKLAEINKQIADINRQTSEERNAQMGASNARFLSGYGNGFIPDTPGTEELQAARRALERAKKLGEEAKRFDQGDTYFMGNVGRGMKDKFWDDGTWDWGRADLRDAKLAMQLKEKIDRGEELTQEEHTMLGAMAEEAQAEMATHGKQTRGYKAGETTMFMLPFMLEMAANPTVAGTKAAAKELAIKATDRIARYAWYKAASRLGQGLAHYLTKGGVHLATAIPGGVAQAATTGIQRVEADYIRRRLGEVVPTVNANGEVEFQGFDDSQVDSEAWAAYKAIMQQGIENATEILGAAMPVGKALSIAGRTATASAWKLGYRNTARILAGLGENVAPLYNYMKNWPVANILEKGNWNGNIEEWMEEQIGMALNGIMGVEDTFTTDEGGMFNLDTQIDTLLGVGLFGTFVSTAATGSYAYNRHQARKKMAQAERLGTNLFGEHWAENKQRIENAKTPKALIGTLGIIAQHCTTAEKMVLFKYADALQRYRAVGLAELAKPQRNPGQPAPLEEKTDDAFSEGAEASTPEEIHAVAQEQKSAEQQLAEADANLLTMIQERLDAGASNTELQQVMESLEAPVRTLAENYIASRAKSQGVAAGAEQRAEQEGTKYSLAVGINEDESNDGEIPLVTTGYYKEQPYYIRSMGGDMAVLADAKGETIEVPAEEVTGIATKPIEELVERHTQEAMDAEQRKAEFYLQHNARTQMDVQPDMVLQNGNVQLIVTGVEGNEVTVVPATYDAEQGGIVPKSGESAQNISLEEAYQLQDRYYDSIDNNNTLQAQADAQQPSVAGADADVRADVADAGTGTDGNVGSGTSQAEATGEVAYPTDKQGHTDYTAIEDPETMASAAQAEFGEDAPAFLDAEIAEAQAVIDNPKSANVERFRARKRISMLNGAKSILAPEAAQTAAEEPRYSVSDDSQQQIPTPEEIEAEAKRRRSEEGHRKIEAMKKDIETLSKALGVKIDYEEGLYEREGCNGKIDGTHITLDPAFPEKSLEFLLGHELTHRMQDLSPELYQQFKMTVINVCPDFAQRRAKIRSLYERAGFKVGNKIPYNWDGKRQISLEQIDDEAIADYVGERYQVADGLEDFIIAMQQPTILRKLMEFANWVLEKLTSLDTMPTRHMQTALNRAFFSAAAANAAEAQAKAESKPTQQAEPQQTVAEEAKEEEQKPAQENKNKRKDNAKKRKKRKAKRYSLATGETMDVELTDDEEEIADTTEQNVLGGVQEDGHLEPVRYSLQGTMAGAGFKSAIVDDDGNQIAMTDEKGNLYVEMDGKRFDHEHHITVDDVKDKETALNYMIDDAIALGSLTNERAEEIYRKYVSMLNAYLDKGVTTTDKDGNVISGFQRVANDWQFIGETVFKTVASNSDDQYAKSIDITKVCKKNEAVINSISNLQRKLGYGITPAQIMDLYLKTIRHGYQVPCPVCYVFSRYINNGKYSTAAINGMKKYGKYLPGQPKAWTVEQWEKELERLEAMKKDKDIENALKKANDDVTKILSEIDRIGEDIMRGRLKGKDRSDAKKRIKMLDKRYRDALNLISQQSLTNWINSFAIHSENGKNVLYTDSPMPKDMKDFETNALDLRLTANTMQKYPAIQRLRKSGGSAAGKEITFAGNNDLGSIIAGLGTATPENAENLYLMAAQETDPDKKKALRKKATEQMRKAIIFAKQQSLRGGQRMWSWSDNIERLAPDVAINLMQLDMLGCTLQSYSKQLEGINLVARMNGYVNGSLMAYGIGYEELTDADVKEVDGKKVLAHDIIKTSEQTGKEMKVAEADQFVYEEDGKMYTLTFDDVVGIQAFDKADPDDGGKVKKGLFALNKTLDKAGNILVGMNDIHVKAAMADDRILFIIPWHSSGQSTHILRQMLSYLGVNLENFNPTDYTDMQEEKDYSKEGAIPDKLTKFWKNHNYEGRKEDGLFPAGFTVESGEGQLSPSQIKYRKMRDAILYGIEDRQPTGEYDKDGKPKYKVVATYSLDNVPKGFDGGIYDNWREEVMADEFLKQVYGTVRDRVQGEWLGKESGNENGLMTSGDRKFIYPYEYWDVTKEQKDADVNGKRYLEYCRRLGFKPKFTGNWKTKNTEEAEKGNFADSPGYWKLLIDRRMYDTNGKYQGLDAVDSAGFEPSLVDPQETGKEFIVTKVADDAGVEEITDDVIETETKRTGKIATVNYDTDIAKAAAKYNETYQKSVEEEKRLEAERKAKEEEEKKKAKDKEKEAKKKSTTKFSLASNLTPNQRNAIQMVNPMAEVESDTHYSIGSGLTKEQIEERIGESLDSKNYNQIRKINPFMGMLYSDKVPETLPYREVFKTPTLDDYYISTRTTFASVGKRPEGNDRESLKSAEEENRRQWSEMKESGKYEWHKSPLSSSEYLIDRKSGDIYRFADHWDIVSSCWWKIDEPQGGDKGIMQIGKSNIKDFKGINPHRTQRVENPAYNQRYEDSLKKTISNYETLLESDVKIQPDVRKRIEGVLENYKELLDRFQKENYKADRTDRVRYSISEKTDREYLDAVESGDMEKAQQMVMEAAKAAMPDTKVVDEDGNPMVVYHGTEEEFTVFKKNSETGVTNRYNETPSEYYLFADEESPASDYGDTKGVYLNAGNLLQADSREIIEQIISEEIDYINSIAPADQKIDEDNIAEFIDSYVAGDGRIFAESNQPENVAMESWSAIQNAIADYARNNGYDGFVFNDSTRGEEHHTYAVFDSNQIKSADPVTYDDSGNVIPLSERFNESNEDIRYSLGGRKPFGGNSGYVGYSMSKRASRARSEGRFPKTDFKKEYGVTDNSLNALVEAGLIRNREWHHTSMYGNRTTFYEWGEPWMADAYTANRKEVERLAKNKPDGYSDALYDLFWNSGEKEKAEKKREEAESEAKSSHERFARLVAEFNEEFKDRIEPEYVESNVVIKTGQRAYTPWWDVRMSWGKSLSMDDWEYKEAVNKVRSRINLPTFEEWLESKGEPVRYSLSTQLDEQYPGWNDGSTKENGGDNTQVTNTKSTYVGIGKWMLDTGQKNKSVLDASSGLGLGTQALREMGIKADDVEPYATSDRLKDNPPTYTSYADIDKQYDVIISNAVLNVIPDDWREGVVKDMAEHTKPGGKMIVNVRDAEEAKKTKNKIELEDENELLVLWPNGNYRHYQKFWTQKELEEDMRQMLGEGWKVERATPRNSGLSGKRAVVCTRTEDGGNGARPELTRNQRMAIAMVTGEPLSEEDTRYSIASKDIADASRFFATDYDVVGEKFKNRNGTVIKRGGSYKGEEFPVGKVLSSNDVYVHKDYANDHMKELEEKGKKYLPEGFKYNCLMYNPKSPDIIRFDEAPGFDKEREPFVGRYIKVDTKEGKIIDEGNSKAIWHGKWQWVGNDYKGFDVREAYEWQRRWASTLNEIAKGGSLPAWNKQLEKFGLPVDEAVNGAQNTRYSIASDGTLVGVHNISEAKLNKAINMGGLVNPSLAVVDTDNGQHTEYGEISLIAPSELIDKKTGRNIGTYDRDAYTPIYPPVSYFPNRQSDANEKELTKGLDEELGRLIRSNILDYLSGNIYNSGLEYIFLKEKHPDMLPEDVIVPRKMSTTMKEVSDRFFDGKEPTYEAYREFPEEKRKEFNLFVHGKGQVKADAMERFTEMLNSPKPWMRNLAKRVLTEEMPLAEFDNFVWNLRNDEREAGKLDANGTLRAAIERVREDKKLASEFEEYQMMTIDNLGYDERIQVGWKADGTRIYRKNTLENVSAYMKKQGRNASSQHWASGAGYLMAKLANNMKSLDSIRKNRGRLTKDADSVNGKLRQRMHEILPLFLEDGNRDMFSNEMNAFGYLEDIIVGGMNPDKVAEDFNRHTGMNLQLTDEQRKELLQLREDVRNMPVRYFETKFERPVTLDEFAAAVVPSTITPRVEKGLKDAGLPIYKYDPETSGSREEVMQRVIGQNPNTRFSIADGDVPAETIEAWDRLARSQRFQLRETMFDYLTAIDKFQEFIAKENRGRVMDYQNAYIAMLALSSRNKAEMDVVDNMLVAPLNQIIKKITGARSRMFGKWDWNSGELRKLDMYLKAKHGLERNRDMAVREALAERLEMELSTARNTYTDAKELRAEIEEINKRYRERLDRWYEYVEDERNSGKEWFEMQKDMDRYAEEHFGADLSKDYAGLSGTDKQNPGLFGKTDDWMEEAYRYVLDYETSRQQADIDELWHRIGALSQYSLNKQNQSGLTSAEYVTEQTRRYQFYVPLRGWNADIAQDEYDYIDSRVGDFGNPIKKARGRQSEAGNVMGALLNIAYRSISTGNKNLAMQKFYNLVSQFNTNGLAVVNSRWMELVDGEWTEVAPQIPQDATPEEVAGILARFEGEMEDKRKNGEAKRIRGKEKMAYKTIGRQKDEHQVRVYIGGEERVITVTGNPRIAQALNGLTNPSVAESDDWMEEKNSAIRNFMAGAFTSKNMAFSLRNLSRDTIHANNYAFCMENFEYWWRFTRNQNFMVGNAANMVKMMRLISGYNKAKTPETEDERLFKEFMENGGATGYTYIQQQDELAKELADMLQKHDKSWANPADYARRFFELTEFFGNAAELSNRFAAYKTSRQMGRSVSRAVSDAKEITLNFNRKGAGKQTKGETSLVRKVASMTNFGRRFILFFNANMQGKYQLLRMLEKHPAKTVATRLVAPAVFMGMMMPIINNVILPAVYQLVGAGGGDDGDDDNYFDSLTDHERSSYLCFRLPNKAGWLKIPLPPDITPMTEMGDLIGAAANGSRDLSGMDVTKCTVDMMSPVNINWGSGDNVNWTAAGLSFAPTAVQPIGQAMTNTNYLGRNIYRKSFTSYDTDPEYRKTYRSTSPLLKELSRVANNIGGGTDYTTSDNIMDVNPALVQHFITSYLGGYGTTAVDITNALYSAYTGEDTSMTIQKVPVVSSFVVFGNKDVTKSRIESAYGEVSAIVNKMKDKESNMRAGYKEAEETGDVERAAKTMTEFNRMREGYDYKFYSLNKEVVKFIKKLDKSPETSVLQENLKYQLMKELTQMYRYRKPGRLNAYDTEDGMQITIDTEDKDGNVKSTPVTKVR